jgi:TfoX/Sxy family transcriptional regulator of competence genes
VAYDEELAGRIREVVHRLVPGGVTEMRMFGGLAFLVDGHMAVTASSRGGLLLRVDPAATGLLDDPHARPFVMRGREMDGWLQIDPDGVRTDADLTRWAELGVTYARSLPPKPRR